MRIPAIRRRRVGTGNQVWRDYTLPDNVPKWRIQMDHWGTKVLIAQSCSHHGSTYAGMSILYRSHTCWKVIGIGNSYNQILLLVNLWLCKVSSFWRGIKNARSAWDWVVPQPVPTTSFIGGLESSWPIVDNWTLLQMCGAYSFIRREVRLYALYRKKIKW